MTKREKRNCLEGLQLYIVLSSAIEWSDQEQMTESDQKCYEMSERNVHESVGLHTVVTA